MLYFSPWKVALTIGACVFGILLAIPNLVSKETAAEFPPFLPSKQVTLGLDLQGGAHLLLQVDMEAVIKERLQQELDSVRTALRDARVLYTSLSVEGNAVTVKIRQDADVDKAMQAIREIEGGSAITILGTSSGPDFSIERRDGNVIALVLTEAAIEARRNAVLDQSIEIVRRRVDELGTREPTIQRQGEDRILLEVPGVQDAEGLKKILGTTAKLTFHLVDTTATAQDAAEGRISPSSMVLPADPETHGPNDPQQYVVRRTALVTGDMLTDAQPQFRNGQWAVSFSFNNAGARRFADITQENVGRPFAIVLDNKVVSAPVIRSPILGGSGEITGGFSTEEANQLAILLRAGALPAPLDIVQERTVGPGLGQDSIEAGIKASIVGMIAVVLYMWLAYGAFGLVANFALLINCVMILGGLSLFGSTLTLPGIAGIVLTIGMAVDANVLIYERIREELRNGKTPLSAIEGGYRHAMSTIVDANITTFIAAFIMFWFGSGPVRGFAVTLSIGIATSVFTAVVLTRMLIGTWVRRRRPKTLYL